MAGTVTVACKLPNGIVLDIRDDAGVVLKSVTLNGSRHRVRPDGMPIFAWQIEGGYGITPNVDEDFWNEWARTNATYGPFQKRMIFALPKLDSVLSKAREQDEIKSGLEPLDVEGKDSRIDARIQPAKE